MTDTNDYTQVLAKLEELEAKLAASEESRRQLEARLDKMDADVSTSFGNVVTRLADIEMMGAMVSMIALLNIDWKPHGTDLRERMFSDLRRADVSKGLAKDLSILMHRLTGVSDGLDKDENGLSMWEDFGFPVPESTPAPETPTPDIETN